MDTPSYAAVKSSLQALLQDTGNGIPHDPIGFETQVAGSTTMYNIYKRWLPGEPPDGSPDFGSWESYFDLVSQIKRACYEGYPGQGTAFTVVQSVDNKWNEVLTLKLALSEVERETLPKVEEVMGKVDAMKSAASLGPQPVNIVSGAEVATVLSTMTFVIKFLVEGKRPVEQILKSIEFSAERRALDGLLSNPVWKSNDDVMKAMPKRKQGVSDRASSAEECYTKYLSWHEQWHHSIGGNVGSSDLKQRWKDQGRNSLLVQHTGDSMFDGILSRGDTFPEDWSTWQLIRSAPAFDETSCADNVPIAVSFPGRDLEPLIDREFMSDQSPTGWFRFVARVNGMRLYLADAWQEELDIAHDIETMQKMCDRCGFVLHHANVIRKGASAMDDITVSAARAVVMDLQASAFDAIDNLWCGELTELESSCSDVYNSVAYEKLSQVVPI